MSSPWRWSPVVCASLALALACSSLAAPRARSPGGAAPRAASREASGPSRAERASSRDERALWITRFDYKTREDVVRAIENAKAAGFDTVLFQVRGNATAFYRSQLEPWAAELGGADPGFDPLEVAIEAAHERG